jgi:CDP-diacylglycerol---glycerol-3-phosphate 3-phosphatidyltransferase
LIAGKILLRISASDQDAVTVPNRITLIRIACIPLFIYFLLSGQALLSHRLIAAGIFVVLSLSDALDGFLARKLGQTTPFGSLLDPLADKLLVYSALLIFVETGKIWAILALLIMARDFLVMGIRVWAAKSGKIISASYTGKLKTASQMAAILFIILGLPFWKILFAVSIVLCLYSGWEYFSQTEFGEI